VACFFFFCLLFPFVPSACCSFSLSLFPFLWLWPIPASCFAFVMPHSISVLRRRILDCRLCFSRLVVLYRVWSLGIKQRGSSLFPAIFFPSSLRSFVRFDTINVSRLLFSLYPVIGLRTACRGSQGCDRTFSRSRASYKLLLLFQIHRAFGSCVPQGLLLLQRCEFFYSAVDEKCRAISLWEAWVEPQLSLLFVRHVFWCSLSVVRWMHGGSVVF